MNKIFFLLFLFFAFLGQAQKMRIGLFTESQLKKVKIAHATAPYHIIADSTYIGLANSNDIIEVFLEGGKISILFRGNKLPKFKKISFYTIYKEESIEFTGVIPSAKSRQYEGDFEFSLANNAMRLVNIVELDTYLEGVVESESGTGQKLEYYKVQALISRTYALKFRNKHLDDGYEICDRVHCQAYLHKRLGSSSIDSAVRQTSPKVLYDQNNELAPCYFSANCGGQTCNPAHVWNETIDGLTSFKDTFCIYTKQATWKKSIPEAEWISFLVNNYNFPIDDSLSRQLLFHFVQTERTAFYLHPGYGIPLRDIREKFHLKSSFFNTRKEGDFIIVEGRGYGHGVGLCQEGAMKMARSGYSYDQIIRYYFPSVKIMDVTYK